LTALGAGERFAVMAPVRRGALVVLAALAWTGSGFGSRQASPLPFPDRVLRSGDVRGFVPVGAVQNVITTPSGWQTENGEPVAELERAGFVRGIWEFLTWDARSSGAVSAVAEYRTAGGARSEVTAAIDAVRHNDREHRIPFGRFAVPGIPGAQGFSAKPLGGIQFDVIFANGRYWYLLGEGYPRTKGIKAGPSVPIVVQKATVTTG
jgi:hypothetical protein